MMAQGVNPKVVSEQLGHANISMTLDVHSHVIPGIQEAAALGFDQASVLASKNLRVVRTG